MFLRVSWIVFLICLTAASCTTSKNLAPTKELNTPLLRRNLPKGSATNYIVKKGDTLYRIALEHGITRNDLIAWNNITNPNNIKIGQVLRLFNSAAPPIATAVPSTHKTPLSLTKTDKATLAVPLTKVPKEEAPINKNEINEDTIVLKWPTMLPKANAISKFDKKNNKGIDINGIEGQAIFAAADGNVVYSGSGLQGYGKLLILKHKNGYLTAYAHNKSLLVKEGAVVKQGQEIATMGNSDTDKVKLHFEVRRFGQPVNPMNYLPRIKYDNEQ